MTPNEYQELAKQTLTPECTSLNYLVLGLASEAGEIAGKQKKWLRGDYDLESKFEQAILPELGDCLWYISMIAESLGISLEYIMRQNIQKLQARKAMNTIKGDGDNR